jgi:voltage-gated potassium channel Kch
MTLPIQTPPAQAGNAGPGRTKRALARPGLFRFSVGRFLVALVLLIFVTAFVEDMKNGHLVEVALATLVLCMGVLAVGGRRRTLILAVFLVLPAVVGNLVHNLCPAVWPIEAVLAARLVFLAFLVAHLLVFILRAPRVNSEVLCAGIAIYLLLGAIWAIAYTLVANVNPDAFAFSVPPKSSHVMAGFNAVYFSYVTLTTVGYGDIAPVSNVARMLAITESMSGTLFVGVLIARLVSLYSAPGPAEAVDNPPNPLATVPGTSQSRPTQEDSAQDGQ